MRLPWLTPILRRVNRLVPTVLAVLAVLGLLLPPRQVVHAHADGHDAHSHGVTQSVHVPLPAHPHPHSNRPDQPAVQVELDVDSDGGSAPEQHVHLASTDEAIARIRGACPAIDGSVSESILPAPGLSLVSWPVVSEGVAPREGRDVPRPCSRSMDRLIVLGRLLI